MYINAQHLTVSVPLPCFLNDLLLLATTTYPSFEITVGHRALTDGNAIMSNGTFLPSDTMADGNL